METTNKPVKKQMSRKKKEDSLKKEPSAAPDLLLEKQEMINKTEAVITDLKEKAGKDKTDKEEGAKEESIIEFEPQREQEISPNQSSSEETTVAADSEAISEHSDESESKEESSNHDVIEFESGLHQLIPEKSKKKAKPKEEQDDNDQSIDFISTLSPDQSLIQKNQSEKINKTEKDKVGKPAIKEESMFHEGDEDSNLKSKPEIESKNIDIDPEITEFFAESEEEKIIEDHAITSESHPEATVTSKPEDSQTANPLKSKAALNTLLALAKTYIGMDDIESARTSLEEILEHGNDMQKAEAQRLLDEIKDK